jgi:AcrR family transcriptional regulator
MFCFAQAVFRLQSTSIVFRVTETATRARARKAIIEAGIAVLSQRPSATLGEIASAAGVGRTTLHRYFPERADLMDAIGADALQKVADAMKRARLNDGPALDAVARVCEEMYELGDLLMLVFADTNLMVDERWQNETDADRDFYRLVERGHADGSVHPDAPPRWAQTVLWALLYAAWDHGRDSGESRHATLARCVRTVRRALAAPAS